jgi:hypothetical protein
VEADGALLYYPHLLPEVEMHGTHSAPSSLAGFLLR